MKTKIICIIFFSLICLMGISQNIGINNTGNPPNASAMLDVDAAPGNNRGLLITRVTFAERTGINFNPLPAVAQGLTVYQTNAGGEGEGFYYNTSTSTTPTWIKLLTQAAIPYGVIWLWSGTIATIPAGWALCDGTLGTPDLRDKFILSVSSAENPGATGGAHSYSLITSQIPSHNHTGTTDADGGFTPSGTISSAGSHNHTWGGNWSNDNSTVVASPNGDGSGNTYTDGVGYWGSGSLSVTSGNTDLTHQHQWGGVWNNDNSNVIASPEGDGGGNTYSDGNLGIWYWPVGSVTSGYTDINHYHNWGNVWSNDDSRWDWWIISDGWAWWNGGGGTNNTGVWAGWHGHSQSNRGSLSGWGYEYASGGGGWGTSWTDGANGAEMMKHRHYIQERNTTWVTGGNAQNHAHALPAHRHYIKVRQTSNNNTGNSMNHNHTVAVPNHRHFIQQRNTSTAADHTHTFAGTAVANHAHTFTSGSTGSGTAIDNRPAYYKLAFIMKQ